MCKAGGPYCYDKKYNKTELKEIAEKRLNKINQKLENAEDPNSESLDDLRTSRAYAHKCINEGNNINVDENNSVESAFATLEKPDGGGTFNPYTKESPITGFCYSPYPEHSKVIKDDLSLSEFEQYCSSENLVDKVINLGQMFAQIKGRDITKDDLLDLFKQDKFKALTDLDKNKIFEHFNLK